MTNYSIISVGGIGESRSPAKMHQYITTGLDPEKYQVYDMPWQDAYGAVGKNWDSDAYVKNIHAAAEELVDVCQRSSYPIVLIGYSGGAHVVSLALPKIHEASGCAPVVAVVFIANPMRNRKDGNAPWWGITGERTITTGEQNFDPRMLESDSVPATVIFDVANPEDVIPCCPEYQPMRDFYGYTKSFSLSDPIAWGMDAMNYASNAVLHGTNGDFFSPMDYWVALAYCRGYLFDGQHTTYYAHNLASTRANLLEVLK